MASEPDSRIVVDDNEMKRLQSDSGRVKDSMVNLYKLQMAGKITPNQTEALKKFEEFRKGLPEALESLAARKEKIEEQLKQHRDACIIGEGTIYPGVQAHFGIIYRDITDEAKSRKLTLEGNTVVMSEWRAGASQDAPARKNP